MKKYFSEVNEDIVDFEKGLLESEIAYQNIVMGSMNEEAIILLSEEATQGESNSVIVNFFIKIGQWFKELASRIKLFIKNTILRIKDYVNKAKEWMKKRFSKDFKHSKKISKVSSEWKDGKIPKLSDIKYIVLVTSIITDEDISDATNKLSEFYAPKGSSAPVNVVHDTKEAAENIEVAPKIIKEIEDYFGRIEKALIQCQVDAKKAANNARMKRNKSELASAKQILVQSKNSNLLFNELGAMAVRMLHKIILDGVKTIKESEVVPDNKDTN